MPLIDKQRTQELNLDELRVAANKGDNINYHVYLSDEFACECPTCNAKNAISNGFSTRKLGDCITLPTDKLKFITLHYSYKKWQCNRSNCRSVFSKPITFARPNAQTTIRLETHIIKLGLFSPFNKIPQQIGGTVTATAVKNIFYRWTERQEAQFVPQTPKTLGIHPIIIGNEMRLIITKIEDENRIIEILPDMTENTLITFLRKLDGSTIKQIITDMSESTWRSIRNVFPTIPILTANPYLLQFAYDTICAAAQEELLNHYSNRIGKILTTTPNQLTKSQQTKLQQILSETPSLEEIHAHIHAFINIGNTISASNFANWKEFIPKSSITLTAFADFVEDYIPSINDYNALLQSPSRPKSLTNYFNELDAFSAYTKTTHGAAFPVLRARALYAYLRDCAEVEKFIYPRRKTTEPEFKIGFTTGDIDAPDTIYTASEPTRYLPTLPLPELLRYLQEKETQLKGAITNEQ